jgi:hypothetical protein
MIEIQGDLWSFHADGKVIGIPTNGSINARGQCVMGRGLAYAARCRFPALAGMIADHLLRHGNTPFYSRRMRLVTIPVKDEWHQWAKLTLIEASLLKVKEIVPELYLPRVGCGYGYLYWGAVRPIVERVLPEDSYVVVEWNGGKPL